jgi:hypothetical protein
MQTVSITLDSIVPQMSSHARAALAAADIVLAVDNRTQNEFTVFGTPALESTMNLKSLSAMQVARVLFDYDCGQLEQLSRIVRRVKGLDSSTEAVVRRTR